MTSVVEWAWALKKHNYVSISTYWMNQPMIKWMYNFFLEKLKEYCAAKIMSGDELGQSNWKHWKQCKCQYQKEDQKKKKKHGQLKNQNIGCLETGQGKIDKSTGAWEIGWERTVIMTDTEIHMFERVWNCYWVWNRYWISGLRLLQCSFQTFPSLPLICSKTRLIQMCYYEDSPCRWDGSVSPYILLTFSFTQSQPILPRRLHSRLLPAANPASFSALPQCDVPANKVIYL